MNEAECTSAWRQREVSLTWTVIKAYFTILTSNQTWNILVSQTLNSVTAGSDDRKRRVKCLTNPWSHHADQLHEGSCSSESHLELEKQTCSETLIKSTHWTLITCLYTANKRNWSIYLPAMRLKRGRRQTCCPISREVCGLSGWCTLSWCGVHTKRKAKTREYVTFWKRWLLHTRLLWTHHWRSFIFLYWH